ncbi:hypothetical protein I79_014262 [Cricetulus griseus]|uniref:Uncharacterized protein n=1 Tax=Cricetulus griseus TaxID=10029 RepID=G3HTN4_CRIGR|nr:hypothetical protein I79_014262 [Cricetulus griseus]
MPVMEWALGTCMPLCGVYPQHFLHPFVATQRTLLQKPLLRCSSRLVMQAALGSSLSVIAVELRDAGLASVHWLCAGSSLLLNGPSLPWIPSLGNKMDGSCLPHTCQTCMP